MFMAALMSIPLFFAQIAHVFNSNNNTNEWDYKSKYYQQEAKANYQKSLLPKSGYMTVEEYEKESVSKDKAVGDGEYIKKVVPESGYVYVPQPNYKFVKYNNPPGSPELHLHRKLFYDRTENGEALISPDVCKMILPVVSYYSKTKSTDCDVYVVPLRKGMSNIEKVVKANIAAKEQPPIFSTDRTNIQYGTFKSITPIDFSNDLTKVLAKEKIGNEADGIWQTEALVYDFNTKKVTRLREVREAIRYYWITTKNLDVREIRWDIYPLGFDPKDSNRILVAAFAYSGSTPRCLGTWSVDILGNRVQMESLECNYAIVSLNGLKIVEDGVVDPRSTKAEADLARKYEIKEKKEKAKEARKIKKDKRNAYREEVKEIKAKYKALKKASEGKDSEDDKSLKKSKVHRSIIPLRTKGGKVTGTD